MRIVENYELVLSGEQDDRLMLTFDWSDLPHLPQGVSHVVFDGVASEFRVTFEDKERWEEVLFVKLPATLHDLVRQFSSVVIVGLSDKVELFVEAQLDIKVKDTASLQSAAAE